MTKEIYDGLYSSRLLRNEGEISTFENNLEKLAESFCEDDICDACTIFDDRTDNVEVMFGMIHLLESLSSKRAYLETIKGISKMKENASEWARVLVYRCLNDENSVEMLRDLYSALSLDIKNDFTALLMKINSEDGAEFGTSIKRILGDNE